MKEAGGEFADIVRLRAFVTDAAYCEPVLKGSGRGFPRYTPGGDDRRRLDAAQAGNEGRDRGGRTIAAPRVSAQYS
jgi:hypothetical protein